MYFFRNKGPFTGYVCKVNLQKRCTRLEVGDNMIWQHDAGREHGGSLREIRLDRDYCSVELKK